jgi:alkaline phosphatase D
MNDGGTPGDQQMNRGIGRRELLVGAASLAALAACGGGDGASGGDSGTTTRPTTRHTARLAGDPFGLGVASGDPRPDSVILWARLAVDPLAGAGDGGMPADRVDVQWEVAADDRFTAVAARGVATADPDAGHSLHVDAGGLDPATDYHYRFTVGEWTSPVGRTRTLAAPGDRPARFSLAVANCQWLDTGRYAAYRHLLDEDLDLVLHLGDYIYEYPGPRAVPDRFPESLADYRLRYAAYRSDGDLQAAHARFPFVCTWDDHEVANNYMGDTLPEDRSTEEVRALKAAAYQAWWEHLPVRLDPPDGSDLAVYRHLDVGDLARLYVLDERQDADSPPCRDTTTAIEDAGDCAERTEGDHSSLGPDQEAWFEARTAESAATWNLIGNPVVLSGVDAGTGDVSVFYLDSWDGFPQARARFIDALAGTSNPVVLTGDYHAGMVLDLHRRPFDQDSEIVATELMSPPISSILFPQDVSARTPQLRQQINAHGYLAVVVEPERLTAAFRVLDDVTDADSPIRTEATWEVEAGDPRARPV